MTHYSCTTRHPAETKAVAARLGKLLQPGDVVALIGELGSGKTTFVQGLAQGLDVSPDTPVSSPSFVLAHEYPGRLTLVHVDLYRLDHVPPEMLPDLEEYLFGGQVAAVEWAERLTNLLPDSYLEVHLAITGENDRLITFTPHHRRGHRLLDALTTPQSA